MRGLLLPELAYYQLCALLILRLNPPVRSTFSVMRGGGVGPRANVTLDDARAVCLQRVMSYRAGRPKLTPIGDLPFMLCIFPHVC
ncbi:hypothetical protein SODG_002219 [Sodalis praecaptivus]